MSAFTYLTGRKELFNDAPDAAMVVLETNEAEPRILYAVAHEQGAQYWEADGTPGRPVGLIALLKKTRVVASRVRADGLPPAEPKRDPIPNARMQRMQAAQTSASKAASGLHSGMNAKPAPAPAKPAKAAPAPAAAKPACQCNAALPGTHHRMCPEFMEAIKEARQAFTPNAVKPADDLATFADSSLGVPYTAKDDTLAQPDVKPSTSGGFVDIFALADSVARKNDPVFIRIHTNGNIGIVAAIGAPGQQVKIQADPARGLVRIAHVETGGKEISKGRAITATAVTRLFRFEEGQSSVRIDLEKVNGWWQGAAVFAEGVHP